MSLISSGAANIGARAFALSMANGTMRLLASHISLLAHARITADDAGLGDLGRDLGRAATAPANATTSAAASAAFTSATLAVAPNFSLETGLILEEIRMQLFAIVNSAQDSASIDSSVDASNSRAFGYLQADACLLLSQGKGSCGMVSALTGHFMI
jgi:hypothetical protein